MSAPEFRHPPGSPLSDLEQMLAQPWGRRIAYRVVHHHGLLHAHSIESDTRIDAESRKLRSYMTAGKRELAIDIEAQLRASDPEAFDLMMAECYGKLGHNE